MGTGVPAKHGQCFFLAVIEPMDFGPLRPGIVWRAFFRRGRQNLKLGQTPASVPQRSSHAVRACVTAADHDHIPALRGEITSVFVVAIEQTLCVGVKKLHREMDSLEISSCQRKIPGPRCAAAKNNRVKVFTESLDWIVLTNIHSGNESDSFRG